MKVVFKIALPILCLTIAAVIVTAQQQGPAPRRGVHVASGKACPCPYVYDFMPQVADVAKARRFYNETLRLVSEVDATRGSPTDAFLRDMYAVQGQIRNTILWVPQTDLEVEPIQWDEAEGKALNLRIQDSGAARLVLSVSNVDAFADRFKTAGVKVITAGGKPIAVPNPTGGMDRILVVQEDNGFFVELVQHPISPPHAPDQDPQSYIYWGDISLTVANVEDAARFYHEVLGLDVRVDPQFHADPAHIDALGLKGAQYREARIAWPSSAPQVSLIEFKGVDRKTLTPLVKDPNALLLRTTIQNMESTLAKVKAHPGAQIMNVSGGPFVRVTPPGRNGPYPGTTQWLIVRVPGSPSTYMQLVGPGRAE